MRVWLERLPQHLPELMVGVTAILLVGLLWSRARRDRASAQRWAECSLWLAAAWLVLAAWPRTEALGAPSRSDAATAAPAVATPPSWSGGGLAEAGRLDGPPQLGSVDGGRPRSTTTPVRFERAEADAEPTTADAANPRPLTVVDASQRDRPVVAAAAEPVWGEVLLWAWGLGGLAALGWMLIGRVGLWRMRRGARRAEGDLAAEWAALAPPTNARLFRAPRASRPFVTARGLFGAAIYLPDHVADAERGTRRAVLAHELAHVRRGDHRARRLTGLCWPLLAIHPLAWWLRARAWHAAEEIADELAARSIDRVDYARRLVDLADRLPVARGPQLVALGALGGADALTRRITSLLDRRRESMSFTDRTIARSTRLITAVALLGSAVATQGVPTPPQDPARVVRLEAENAALRTELTAMSAKVDGLTAQLTAVLQRLGGEARHDLDELVDQHIKSYVDRRVDEFGRGGVGGSAGSPADAPATGPLDQPRDWSLQGQGLIEFARSLASELGTRVVISAVAARSPRAGEHYSVSGTQVVLSKALAGWLGDLFGLTWRRESGDVIRIVVPGELAPDDPLVRVEEEPAEREAGFGFTSSRQGTFADTDGDGLPDTLLPAAVVDTDGDGLPDRALRSGAMGAPGEQAAPQRADAGRQRDAGGSLATLELARQAMQLQMAIREAAEEAARLEQLVSRSLVPAGDLEKVRRRIAENERELEMVRALVAGEREALRLELQHLEESLAQITVKGEPQMRLQQRLVRVRAQLSALEQSGH